MNRFLLPLCFILIIGCKKQQFEIEGTTEYFKLYSMVVEDNYKIGVFLPPAYPENNVNYPLIVGLDGDFDFEPVAGIVSEMIKDGDMPPSIFIGIGYGSLDKNDKKRNRDYTPSKGEIREEKGEAENFYHFIRDELFPEIESRYQVDTNNTKTLLGHSFGGLFTQYAMFQERSSNPFDKFIPAATSYWYDSGVIFESEEAYAQQHNDCAVQVYTTMGSLEGVGMVAAFDEMNERLKERNYPNLELTSVTLKKYGHNRSAFISYENGLKALFND